MTVEQRKLWGKLGEILDALPASDEYNELLRLWYRIGGTNGQSSDWAHAAELLEQLDLLVLGAAVCMTDNQSDLKLTARAASVLAHE
jgi:hypothetical protein